MDLTIIGLTGICLLFILIFLEMPVPFAMALVGFAGACAARSLDAGLSIVALVPFRLASTYIFAAVPLFILMGFMAAHTGLSRNAFYVANRWIGHIRGGMAVSTVVACTAFGAMCGANIAAAGTMSTVTLPEMRRYGYSDSLSLGCIAAGSNLSFLIPPSIGFIIYAILEELSIGKLFIAGILPGLLFSLLFVITILILCRINPSLASVGEKASWKERFASLRFIWGFLILIIIVLGGIYGGIFSPTEAGAIGAFGTIALGMVGRQITWNAVTESFRSTASLTGMTFMLLIGAMIFSSFMTLTEIPLTLAGFVAQLSVPPYVILGIVLVFYVIIGFVIDIMSVIILMVPIVHPALASLGFDPILLGVLTIITVIMGGISPPFGIIVFTIAGVVKDVPIFTIFRGALPFLVAMFVGLVLIIVFPDIALLLPRLMH